MDRYLISGVVGLLILQIAFLLQSLGLISPFDYVNTSGSSDHQVIGKMIKKRQNVKHKAADSIIWEEANTDDSLYRFDSVLTLDNSSAQLDLEERVSLQVEENTLVMLEPVVAEELDSLRVRFYKGQMRARNRQRLSFGTGGWSMEAVPGTDMTLRSLENDRVELEIAKGSVSLSNRVTGENKTYSQGRKLTLAKESIDADQEVTAEMRIEKPIQKRIYSHTLPVRIPLEWIGEATRLHIVHPNRREENIPVSDQHVELTLDSGNHAITLEDATGKLSATAVIEIVPAPRLRYLSPLPRDRAEVGIPQLFSWYPLEGMPDYELELQSGAEHSIQKTKLPYSRATSNVAGEYLWRVTAFDSDAVPVPPYYSLPIYFTPAPLAAPTLGSPIQEVEPREPANSEELPPDGASHYVHQFLEFAFTILVTPVSAAETRQPIVFTWSAVEGADLYVIEISSSPDFLNPEVIERTPKREYVWKSYSTREYYWRVAGEARDGRKGLFSSLEKFDVAHLKTNASSGPHFQEPAKASPPNTVALTPIPTPPAPAPAQTETPDMPPTFFELKGLLDYWYMQHSTSDINKISFRGLAVPSLGVAKSWNATNKTYVTEIQMQTLKWQPKNPADLPFQKSFTTRLLTFKASELKDGFSFGFIIKQIPVFKRASLEEVEARETLVYGPSAKWASTSRSRINYASEFALSYGGGIIQPTLQNTAQYFLDSHSSVGAMFEISGAFGENSASSQWVRVGLQYGFRW